MLVTYRCSSSLINDCNRTVLKRILHKGTVLCLLLLPACALYCTTDTPESTKVSSCIMTWRQAGHNDVLLGVLKGAPPRNVWNVFQNCTGAVIVVCVTLANGGLKARTSKAGKQLWRAPKGKILRQNSHLALVN